jgi:integrating conjugative element protein (TIGR03752 family)
MKSSGLLKWLMLPVAVLVIFAGIKLFSHGSKPGSDADSLEGRQLTAQESKDLGVGGDTPHDTVATLVGQVKLLRNEVKAAMEDGRQQKEENERLRARESTVDTRIQETLKGERERLRQDREQTTTTQQQAQSLLQDLQQRVDALGAKGSHEELPIGLGLEDGDLGNPADQHVHWYEPQDRPPSRGKPGNSASTPTPPGARYPGEAASSSFGQAAPSGATGTDEHPGESSPSEALPHISATAADVKPTYTIPTNATLMGSVAMTALIGRVPVDGTVNDPFPFKVVIGADNLTANGIELPDVAGAIVSGTASGDWTLSCVRGLVRSITFVFHDGTVRTLPSTALNVENAVSTRTGLGWISDPYGIPCVSGSRRSNAVQYLTSEMLITAAAAGAAASIDSKSGSNFTYLNGSNGDLLGTVGITAHEAAGRILAGGVQEMSKWIDRLYGQAFAAVYVEPGAQVAVHIDEPLNIDYEKHGRKVSYETGEKRDATLD